MKKVYHLSTCSTCQRILKEWDLDASFVLQDIKTNAMTEQQVDHMIKMAGSADALFSRRAIKYKALGLKGLDLSEAEIRNLIVAEYTFLKRPVMILNDQIFVGNSKNVVAAAKLAVQEA